MFSGVLIVYDHSIIGDQSGAVAVTPFVNFLSRDPSQFMV